MIHLMLAVEIAVYFAFAIVISFHLAEKHSWKMPLEPIFSLWADSNACNINMAGKILAQVVASFFTVRFAMVGFVMLGIYYFSKAAKTAFIWLFKKR